MSLFFFLIIGLYFFIPEAISQACNPTAALAIPAETTTNEVNAKIKAQPPTTEITKKNFQSNSNFYTLF